MGISIPLITGGLSMAGGLGGLFGGGNTAKNVQLPPMWQLPGMTDAANSAQTGIGGLGQYNLAGATIPQFQSSVQSLMQNPYAAQMQAGAGVAGGLGQQGALSNFGAGNAIQGMGYGAAPQANNIFGLAGQTGQQAGGLFNTGNFLTGQGAGMLPYAQPMLQAGFDPQSALYDRTLQQVQDQSRVGQAARGIQNTPYGAGLENQNLRNFNIDWQNNQLQRMLTGAQGANTIANAGGGLIGQGVGATGAGISGLNTAGGLFGQGINALGGIGNLLSQGAGLMAGAPQQYASGAGMPYNAFNTIGGNNLGWLNQLGQFGGQAAQIPQQQIGDYLNYLGAGNNANQVANQRGQLGLNQAQMVNQQNQQFGQQLGFGANQFGNAFQKGFPSFNLFG